MKQTFLKIFVISVLLGTSSVSYAETNVDVTNVLTETKRPTFLQTLKNRLQGVKDIRVKTRADIKDVRNETKDKIKALNTETREKIASTTEKARMEAKTEMQNRIEEKRTETVRKMVINRFDNMNAIFDATITRLEGIMGRIDARIEKIKNAGKDTAVAEKLTAEARISISTAKTLMINLKSQSETAVILENATTTKTAAKNSLVALTKLAKDIEKNLQNARASLEKAVVSLKGLSQN